MQRQETLDAELAQGPEIRWKRFRVIRTKVPLFDLGIHMFKGPIIPFGTMVEYHPVSAKDLSCRDCINSARKSYQEHSSVMFCTRGESGKET